MTEQSAQGVQGFLLYDAHANKHFFRVYDAPNPGESRKTYQDYEICIEDLKITIDANSASLFKSDVKSYIGWSSKYLSGGQKQFDMS